MKINRIMAAVAAASVALLSLSACGSSNVTYKDGTYTAQSSVFKNDDGTDDGNGYGVVTITITDGVISDATFETFEEDGTLKDTEYGKERGEIANRDFYNKAQKAVAACDEYANMLVANGGLDGIDAISGATVNYDHLTESVTDALKQAEVEE